MRFKTVGAALLAGSVFFAAAPVAATFAATPARVHVAKTPAHRGLRYVGTFVSTDGKTLTIAEKNGTRVTFTLTAKTRYIVNRQRVATEPAFKAGQTIRVLACKNKAGQLIARRVATKTTA